jgi:hypothetical protein
MRIDVGARVAAIVERQAGAMADLMRHVVGEPQALARAHQTDHAVHHVVVYVTVKDEVAFQPAQGRTGWSVRRVLRLFFVCGQ